MTTIVKARNACDFLALVPYLLGFQPHDSIVLVAFRGNRTRGAMRFDLPKTDAALARKRIATTMIGMLCKLPQVDALVPVAFTDDPFANPIPHRPFIEALLKRAESAGFLVREALCVAADGWGSYLEPDCPPAGHSLAEISTAQIGARIPGALGGALGAVTDGALGGSVLGAVTDGAVIPEADLGTAERVARLLGRFRRVVDTPGARPVELGVLGEAFRTDGPLPVYTLPRLIELALHLDPTRIQDRDAALILWLLQRPAARDAVILQVAFGPAAGFRVLFGEAKFKAGDDSAVRESAALLYGDGPRPDPARITAGITLLTAVTGRAPTSARPAALCCLAWLHWALGRGSVAGSLAQRALAIDPDYGFADLLLAMLDAGRLPEWAFEAAGS